MRKIVFVFMLLLSAINSQAVLKENSLGRTLGVLKLELENQIKQQKVIMKRYETQSKNQHTKLIDYMQRCEQISLMLYSQNQDFTFDMAYACQAATDLFHELRKTNIPYDKIKERVHIEIERYDSLISALEQLPPRIGNARLNTSEDDSLLIAFSDELEDELELLKNNPYVLDKGQRIDRKKCLMYAIELRKNIEAFLEDVSNDNKYYTALRKKVENLNKFALEKYSMLQQSIFINGGTNYFTILGMLPMQLALIQRDFGQKYMPLGDKGPGYSEWRGPVVLFSSVFILFYILVAALLSNLIIRKLLPKRFQTETFKKKRPVYIMALAIFIFALVVMILRTFVIKHNLMLMATGLMINIAWLMEVIFLSLLFRLNGEQIKNGLKMYVPFIFMSLIVIWFRIVLIPNSLVNLIYPLILLIFTIWQVIVIKKWHKGLPLSDRIYCAISLATMLASCIMAWSGFTLMAVQVMIWWMFQLSAIATITCCYDLMEYYEEHVLEKRIKSSFGNKVSDKTIREKMRQGIYIEKTWIYDFVKIAFVPVGAVLSILFSITWAADIFEMRSLCSQWFFYDFINEEGVIKLSLFKVCLVFGFYFIFRYFNYLFRSLWFKLRRGNIRRDFNETLAKNIVAITVWGSYIIFIFLLLRIPRSGIEIVMTGLAAGLGFASKDILENFIYGLSLMTGRVRVGDYIECDGITGKVESITYQSTQITTLDGSVIAFLNSALFNKNFKNLTRNHEYELIKIPLSVAYGTNVENVRQMVIERVNKLNNTTSDGRYIVNPKNPIQMLFSDFGDSSVNLQLVLWVLVDQKIVFTAKVKEEIYNVLNENNIEIPFPQHDVYIKSIAKMKD